MFFVPSKNPGVDLAIGLGEFTLGLVFTLVGFLTPVPILGVIGVSILVAGIYDLISGALGAANGPAY